MVITRGAISRSKIPTQLSNPSKSLPSIRTESASPTSPLTPSPYQGASPLLSPPSKESDMLGEAGPRNEGGASEMDPGAIENKLPQNDSFDNYGSRIERGDARDATSVVSAEPSPFTVENIGRGMKNMFSTVNRLRNSGFEDMKIPLPKIAVIGSQSAGKSSLVEAISGVSVPRQSGTCTRCPLEVALLDDTDTTTWKCDISLRINHRYDEEKTREGKLPWTLIAQKQNHFVTIKDRNSVGEALIRAQCAILNPTEDWRTFLHPRFDVKGARNGTKVKFSPNVICIDIKGPGLPNLTFIDLPGLFHVTERQEDEYLIGFVRDLVIKHISTENCLVLLTMTMKDDAVNQSAVNLAMKYAEGRTIGALTKPDTLTDGEFDQWFQILKNKAHILRNHGYFVTKHPSQEQLLRGITHGEARNDENNFFRSKRPWNTAREHHERLGTARLQEYLSESLGNLIKRTLPSLVQKVDEEMASVDRQLRLLPPPPQGDCFCIVMDLIDKIIRDWEWCVDNDVGQESYRYKFQKLWEQLQSNLRNIRPRLNTSSKSPIDDNSPFSFENAYRQSYPQTQKTPTSPRFGPEVVTDHLTSGSKRSGDDTPNDRQKRRRTSDEFDEAADISYSEGIQTERQQVNKKTYMLIHLKEVRNILQVLPKQFPNNVDQRCVDQIIRMWTKLWDEHVHKFLNELQDLINIKMLTVIANHYIKYKNTELANKTFEHIPNFLKTVHQDVTRKGINQLLCLEKECVFTANRDSFATEHELSHTALSNRRRTALMDQHGQAKPSQATKSPLKRNIAVQHEIDPYEVEVSAMAQVTAYSTISRRRFLDNCVMHVNGVTIPKIKSELRCELYKGLGLDPQIKDNGNKCEELLARSHEIQRKRKELEKRKQALIEAKYELRMVF